MHNKIDILYLNVIEIMNQTYSFKRYFYSKKKFLATSFRYEFKEIKHKKSQPSFLKIILF